MCKYITYITYLPTYLFIYLFIYKIHKINGEEVGLDKFSLLFVCFVCLWKKKKQRFQTINQSFIWKKWEFEGKRQNKNIINTKIFARVLVYLSPQSVRGFCGVQVQPSCPLGGKMIVNSRPGMTERLRAKLPTVKRDQVTGFREWIQMTSKSIRWGVMLVTLCYCH